MYTNKATINTTAALNSGSDFVDNYYWSSTEGDNDIAWGQNVYRGNQGNDGKGSTNNVRAVRAF